MRIIAGSLKSRKIDFPKNKLTRPMTDRSKETLFNILGSLVPGKHVLDLYAGSGSLGLEALSRGAFDAVFVDRADWASKVIKRNLEALELTARAQVIESDVLKAIERFEKKGDRFSLIFVDPPFDQGLVEKTLIKLDQSDIVAPFAQVVVGHSAREIIPGHFETLDLTRSKKLGQAYLSFLFRVESKHGETKSYLSGQF
ncbi:MAG: 16S rRNA (guanine(966)-N(2))-methyltransferase RsmD [Omnitrophica bacterium GWA2_52_12]|nr:MAG: 16S rRNA (guanine(966)-N(2))-methyltransferase RsmD [Omnitrophica bacterium GWA2_52_12]